MCKHTVEIFEGPAAVLHVVHVDVGHPQVADELVVEGGEGGVAQVGQVVQVVVV